MPFPSNYSSHPTKAWLLMPLISLFIITATTLGESRWEGRFSHPHGNPLTCQSEDSSMTLPVNKDVLAWNNILLHFIQTPAPWKSTLIWPTFSLLMSPGDIPLLTEWPVGRALPSQRPPSALRKVSDSPSYSRTLSHQSHPLLIRHWYERKAPQGHAVLSCSPCAQCL